jgi:hypothetical protein
VTGEGRTVVDLVQPTDAARPLFDAAVAFRKNAAAAAWPLLRGLWPVVAGALLVLLMLLGYMVLGFNGELRGARGWAWPVLFLFVLLTAAGTLVVAAAVRTLRLVRALVRDGSGVGTGMPEHSYDTTAFTPWLHQAIQRCAGRRPGDPVLTFGDLRDQGVNLELVATDVQAGRITLPGAIAAYRFDIEELTPLFPRDVVDHVKQHGADPDALPVVVAARISAGVPGLLSAVPASVDGERRLLCDGRLAGGMPVDHFDAWVPQRPTFGPGRDADDLDWEMYRFERYTHFMRTLQTRLMDEVEPAFAAFEPALRDGWPGPPAFCRAAARSTRQLLDAVASWGTAGRADFRGFANAD